MSSSNFSLLFFRASSISSGVALRYQAIKFIRSRFSARSSRICESVNSSPFVPLRRGIGGGVTTYVSFIFFALQITIEIPDGLFDIFCLIRRFFACPEDIFCRITQVKPKAECLYHVNRLHAVCLIVCRMIYVVCHHYLPSFFDHQKPLPLSC